MSKIKKKQIIVELFSFITRSLIKQNVDDPLSIVVSLKEFTEYLNEKLSVNITSTQHIYQQIRLYERENCTPIFKKLPSAEKSDIFVSLIQCQGYQDKLFLHIGLKLAIANGAYDLMCNLYERVMPMRPLNIYLSAGTESYYLAQLLFEKYKYELNIYTHNLGIISNFLDNYFHLKNINIYSRFGMVHKETVTLLEQPKDLYGSTKFDIVIGTASFADKKSLYIESEEENKYKKQIYDSIKGPRMLLLTTFEFLIPAKARKYKYADIDSFDYMVVPSDIVTIEFGKMLKLLPFENFIKYYTYEILKKKSTTSK